MLLKGISFGGVSPHGYDSCIVVYLKIVFLEAFYLKYDPLFMFSWSVLA